MRPTLVFLCSNSYLAAKAGHTHLRTSTIDPTLQANHLCASLALRYILPFPPLLPVLRLLAIAKHTNPVSRAFLCSACPTLYSPSSRFTSSFGGLDCSSWAPPPSTSISSSVDLPYSSLTKVSPGPTNESHIQLHVFTGHSHKKLHPDLSTPVARHRLALRPPPSRWRPLRCRTTRGTKMPPVNLPRSPPPRPLPRPSHLPLRGRR